jgi:hypothetical protein
MFENLNGDALKGQANVCVSERVAAALASRCVRRGRSRGTGGRRRVEQQ